MPSRDDTAPDTGPLDLIREELMALDADALQRVDRDVSEAAMVVLGALPQIAKYRAELVATFGEERARQFDRLELLARAALQAEARHRAFEADDVLGRLGAKVTRQRALLRAEASLLVARGLLEPSIVDDLRHGLGFKNVSFDVLQLVTAIRECWDQVHEKTGLTLGELDEAENAADRLVTGLGMREQGVRAPSAELRIRAFNLLSTTYDDARHAMAFVRRKQRDADQITPSFYRGRGGRPRSRPAPARETPTEHSELPVPAEPIREGMPGSSPFSPDDATDDTTVR
jgi:hypothetical protein